MPARILLVTAGSFGDLFPTLGLAGGLKGRGHHVSIATSPHYRARVEADGFAFHPVRPDLDPSDPGLLKLAMDPLRGSEHVVRELAMPYLRQSYEDLEAACAAADLVVSHPITFAVPIAAARLKRRWISTVLAPLSFFSSTDFPVLRPLAGVTAFVDTRPWAARALLRLAQAITRPWTKPVRELRRDLGLPPADDALYRGQFSPYGTLALFSPVLGPPQPDWPARTAATGFIFYGDDEPMPPALDAFLDAGEPPIVFTLGSSAVATAGAFYRDSALAAAALGRRAVLLIGTNPANQQSSWPAGVLPVAYAPHRQLFARAAAVVHHGGVGTTGEALRAGHPQLVVPFAHDQPDNAARIKRMGAGRIRYPKKYAAREVAGDLDAMLGDAAMTQAAKAIGDTVRSERGVANACDAIEQVLGSAV